MRPPATQVPHDAHEALEQLRQVGGDDLVRTLMRTFVEFADAQLLRAEAAAARGDVAEVARVAHSLKSSARQVGANPFADASLAAERAGLAVTPDAGSVQAAVAVMRERYDGARDWLAALAARD